MRYVSEADLSGETVDDNSVGGMVEAFYYAFGETDVFAIVYFPDNVSAAAFSLAENGAGQANVEAAVLLTPEEMDQAAKKAKVCVRRAHE